MTNRFGESMIFEVLRVIVRKKSHNYPQELGEGSRGWTTLVQIVGMRNDCFDVVCRGDTPRIYRPLRTIRWLSERSPIRKRLTQRKARWEPTYRFFIPI